MAKKKASMETLNGLHEAIAKYYNDVIGECTDEDGQFSGELSSGTLAAINAFLKNNNITADVVESEPLQNLSYKIQELVKEA